MDGGDGWGGGGGILEFNLFSPPINSNDFGDPHKYIYIPQVHICCM